MANFCTKCGTKLENGQKFCIQCGQKVDIETEIERGTFRAHPEPFLPPSSNAEESPPPPPPSGHVFAFRGPRLTPQQPQSSPQAQTQQQRTFPGQAWTDPGATPPLVEPWGFQNKTTEVAAQIIQKLNQSGFSMQTGFGGMIGRMIRACLLDKTIYREVFMNASLNNEAWAVIGLVIALTILGPFLLRFSLPGIMSIISMGLIQLISLLAWIWVVQMGSSIWLKRKLGFMSFFRALAYAQSPGILQIIPVVGQFVNIWRLVTSMVAIRGVTGCQTFQAAVLSIVGFIGALIAARYVPSIIGPMFNIF